MINFRPFVIISLTIILWHIDGFCGDSGFKLTGEPQDIMSPLKEMGIGLFTPRANVVPFDIRQAILKAPGDYFVSPHGAAEVSIPETTKEEIRASLLSTINSRYFDDYLLDSLRGYTFQLGGEDQPRGEYYIRYSRNDTIFVISGWLGKFISFYRAVPGHKKYSFDDLQKAIAQLIAIGIEIPHEAYEKSSRDNPYFIEYIDREKIVRVRCYHISEIVRFDEQANNFITDPYTLIEITRFIDKETMP